MTIPFERPRDRIQIMEELQCHTLHNSVVILLPFPIFGVYTFFR